MKTSLARSAFGVRRLAARFPAPEFARAEASLALGQSGSKLPRSKAPAAQAHIDNIFADAAARTRVEAQRIGHNRLTSYLLNPTILEVSGHGLTS